jgi:glutamine phosphoribosylpyrophosphate amidotransferase
VLFYFGVEAIYQRLAHPPICYDCGFGIDMKTASGLFAAGLTQQQAEERLCADLNLEDAFYLSVEENAQTQKEPVDRLCYGCTTGDYRLLKVVCQRDKLALENT